MAAITVYPTSINVINVTAHQAEDSSLEDLIKKARKDHYTPTIAAALNLKITSLEQDVHYSSARSGLLKLFLGLSDAHYNQERMRILDALIRLLENDPLTRETSSGIIEFVRDLTGNMKADIAQCDNIQTREKMAHCCATAVEMVLRHGVAGKDSGTVHIGSITEALKVELIAITKDFASLNTKKEGANLAHSINLAIEGMKRITSNLDVAVDTIQRLSYLITGVSKIADYDLESAIEAFKKAADGLENRITESWYDILFTIKRLSKLISRETNLDIARQNLSALQRVISDNKVKNWNLTYGSIHALTHIAMNSPHPQIRQVAIFGLAPISGISNARGKPIHLYGCIHFLSFKEFTAKNFRKSEISKKDLWISKLAEMSLRAFINRAHPTDREICSALTMVWPEGRIVSSEASTYSRGPSERADLPVAISPLPTSPTSTSLYTPISSSPSPIIFSPPAFGSSTSASPSTSSPTVFGTAVFDPSRNVSLTDRILALENENRILRKQQDCLRSDLALLRKTHAIRLWKNWNDLSVEFLNKVFLFLPTQDNISAHKVSRTWSKMPCSHIFHIFPSKRRHFTDEDLQRYTFNQRLKDVRDLNLAGTSVSDLQCIRFLPLNRLDVSNTSVGDRSLEYLKDMPLNELVLNQCGEITDSGIELLSNQRFLYALHVSGTRVTANVIVIAASMPFLHTLSVSGISIRDNDLVPLSHKTALRFLNLSRCPDIDGSCFQHFTGMSRLEHLNLANTKVNDEAARYFSHMNLRVLNLSETLISDNCLPEIGNLGLISLNLWGNEKLTNAGIKHLSRMASLEDLNVGGCIKLTDDGITCISSMPLHTLDLYATGVTDAIYGFIKGKRLISLSLRRCTGITTLAPLAEHHLLRSLNISGIAFPNAHIHYLSGMRNLTDLHLRDTPITDVELPCLYHLPLRMLDISKTRVSTTAVVRLKEALPECRIVT